MEKPNKAPQKKISARWVDSSQLFTPTAYAKHIGLSRQRLYVLIENGKIPSENIVEVNGGTLILAERK